MPLQAADLMAYELTKSIIEPGRVYRHRWAIDRLIENGGGMFGGYFDRDALLRIVNHGASGII